MPAVALQPADSDPFDVVGYCAAWWPTGAEDTDANRALVDLVRAKALEARPQSREQARRALLYGWRFVHWLSRSEAAPLTAGFTFGTVDRFLAEEAPFAPPGTRGQMRADLRRLCPEGIPFDRRRVPSRTGSALSSSLPADRPRRTQIIDDPVRVAAEIDDYVLTVADPARWSRVAPVVRDLVWASAPLNVQAAAQRCRAVGWLCVWADDAGVPLRPHVLLRRDTRNRFLRELAWDDGTARAYDSLLNVVADALGLVERPPPRHAKHVKPPYSDDEVATLLAWCDRAPTRKRTRATRALMALQFGAGLESGTEIGEALTSDVVAVDGRRYVRVRRRAGDVAVPSRLVPVRHQFSALLADVHDDCVAADDVYLLGGTAPRYRDRRSFEIVSDFNSWNCPVAYDPTRARNTWLVWVLDDLGAAGLLDAAGLLTFDSLTDLIRWLPDRPERFSQLIAGADR